MLMYLTRRFKFDAAHHIEGYKGACQNTHGHSFIFDITVYGDVKNDGMLIDFKKLKAIIKTAVVDRVDHKYLNDTLPFNPTAENLAKWIYKESQKALNACGESVIVTKVKLWENYPECCVECYGGD